MHEVINSANEAPHSRAVQYLMSQAAEVA